MRPILQHGYTVTMSFWLYSPKKAGRRKLYSVSLPLLPFIALIGLLVALVLPLIHGCLR
jgi:hypothetical protein